MWSRELKFTRGFRTFIWYIIAAILPTSNLGQLYIRVITGRVSVQSHMQKYAKQFWYIYKIQLNLCSFYNILYTVQIPYVILQRNDIVQVLILQCNAEISTTPLLQKMLLNFSRYNNALFIYY